MSDPIRKFIGSLNGQEFKVEVFGNVDKCDDTVYYTFRFDENNWVVISKYKTKEWFLVNKKLDDTFAAFLGYILDKTD